MLPERPMHHAGVARQRAPDGSPWAAADHGTTGPLPHWSRRSRPFAAPAPRDVRPGTRRQTALNRGVSAMFITANADRDAAVPSRGHLPRDRLSRCFLLRWWWGCRSTAEVKTRYCAAERGERRQRALQQRGLCAQEWHENKENDERPDDSQRKDGAHRASGKIQAPKIRLVILQPLCRTYRKQQADHHQPCQFCGYECSVQSATRFHSGVGCGLWCFIVHSRCPPLNAPTVAVTSARRRILAYTASRFFCRFRLLRSGGSVVGGRRRAVTKQVARR